jgi:DNA repair exonuclease SbcCD nuclease subunit
MTVTLLWRTDVHLSDHTPRSRKDDWTATVISKLTQIGELARTHGAAAVLDGGDFFDLKSPTRNSHALIQQVLAVHRGYPCPVYANVGNHDCVYGDYSFLPQQPLGVLYESGAFRRCYDEHEALFVGKPEKVSDQILDIVGSDSKWVGVAEAPVTVRVVGVPYHGTKYDLDRFARIKKGSEDYLVVIAHVLASPTGGMLFESEDVIKYADLDGFDGDIFCFGHWHKDQGITQTSGGKTILNTGSLTRGSLSQDDLDRKPSVVRLDFSEGGVVVTQVPLLAAASSEVFDLATRDQVELRSSMMEDFVGHLQAVLSPATRGSLRDAIRALPGIPDEVKEQAVFYVEKAGGR